MSASHASGRTRGPQARLAHGGVLARGVRVRRLLHDGPNELLSRGGHAAARPRSPKPLGRRVELIGASPNFWSAGILRRRVFASSARTRSRLRWCGHWASTLTRFSGVEVGPRSSRSPETAAELLISRTTVEPIKDSMLAYIRYEDTDPKRCQNILNAIVRVYLAHNLETATSISVSALEWLNGQPGSLKLDLEMAKRRTKRLSPEEQHPVDFAGGPPQSDLPGQLEAIAKGDDLAEHQANGIDGSARRAGEGEERRPDAKWPQPSSCTIRFSSTCAVATARSRETLKRRVRRTTNSIKVLALKAKLQHHGRSRSSPKSTT